MVRGKRRSCRERRRHVSRQVRCAEGAGEGEASIGAEHSKGKDEDRESAVPPALSAPSAVQRRQCRPDHPGALTELGAANGDGREAPGVLVGGLLHALEEVIAHRRHTAANNEDLGVDDFLQVGERDADMPHGLGDHPAGGGVALLGEGKSLGGRHLAVQGVEPVSLAI